jgi:CRISPR-associated exonuclease Cas4
VHEAGEEVRRGIRTVTGMPLHSLRLGLSGIADVVELHRVGERWRPYPVEHKRGRAKSHRADEVQLCAQAIALEEMFDTSIPEGALFYGMPRRRTVVVFDDALRDLTAQTASSVRACFEAGVTPTATYEPARCDPCSLIELCRPKSTDGSRSVKVWLDRMIGD